MKKYIRIVFAFFCLLNLTGCSKALQNMYGMAPYRVVNEQDIVASAQYCEIPPENLYVLDTAYRSFVVGFRQEFTSFRVENHIHPLQAVYYNATTGSLVNFQTGIYADNSLRNFQWDKEGQFRHFPPHGGAPLDSMFSLKDHLRFIQTLDGKPVDPAQWGNVQYIVVVHWARFAGRQSKRLVKTVLDNYNQYGNNRKAYFLFVNTDNLYDNTR